MSSSASDIDSPLSSSDDRLELALEEAINGLESDQGFDRDALIAKYPDLAEDLHAFVDNWLSMEQATEDVARVGLAGMAQPQDDLCGRTIGDYEILERIGSGGMGLVFRARHTQLDRVVALKMVWNSSRDKSRFRIEAEAAASLHHANIVAIHEIGELEGQPYLSMQLIDGKNLQQRLDEGPLMDRDAAHLVRTLADAVHYAHQRGVLHRDLKPANVLLDEDEKPFVTDFGLAKQLDNSVEITRSGAILGTPGYMAPEQAMGRVKSVTVAADVYGLGAILYAVLTGQPPFRSDSDLLTLRQIIEDPPVAPRSRCATIDRNVETICLKCLEKNPAQRYASAKHLAEDLERYLRGEPVAARPIGIIEQRWRWCCRNPMLAATSILALLLLLATLIVSLSFAYREATARMATEQSRMREVAMRKIAATERANAESQYRVAQQALATLYTHNGIWASQADLDGDALLWFARAAQLEGIDDVSSKMNGQRCHSWLHSSPIPVSTHWFDVSGIDDITRNWSLWQMCPNQPFLTFKSNGQFGVWNYKNDEIWRPSNELWCVASASWNEHGDRLALGCHTGHTHVVDSFSKTLLATYILDAPVVHVTFFGTGTQLAIATQRSVAVADFDSESTVRVIYNVEEGNIASVVVAPDNDTVAISTTDGTVALVSLSADAGTLISQIEGLHYDQQTANLNFLPVFSADSSRIIVRSRPRTVEVFDVGMGTSVSRRLLTEEEFAFAVSADRRRCAVGGDTYARPLTLRWSPDRVEMIRHNLRLVHQDAVTDLCFGGNDLIATCGQNQQVKLWSLKGQSSKTGRYNERAIPLATLAHTERVVGMRMGVSADTLITVQRDGLARVWQVPDFKPPGYYVQTNRGGSTIRLLDQGHWIIAGTTHWDGHVVRSSVRRTKDGMVFAETPQRHLSEMGAVLDTGISTDASILVSLHSNPHRSADTIITEAEYAGSIQLWQLPGGAAIGQAIRTSAEPRSVVILPGATTAAVLLADWRVVFVDFARCEIDRTIEPDDTMVVRNVDAAGRPTELFNGRLEYRGDAMVSWGLGTGLHVYDPSGKRLKCRTEFARQWDIRNLALSPDGATIALSTSSDRLMLINSNNGQILQELIHSSPIESISFSADAKIVLTGSLDGRVRMFYVATGERKGTDLVHNDGVLDAVVSPDYTCLAALTMDRRIIVWDVATGMWGMRPIVAPIGTKRVLFSSDSRYLLTMGIGTECLVCDLAEAMQSCDDLQRATLVGELLSGKRASNEMDNLTSEQWLQRWQAFQGISK